MNTKQALALADEVSQSKQHNSMTETELALCVLAGVYRLVKLCDNPQEMKKPPD